MSLRKKPINFDASFNSFRDDLHNFFSYPGLGKVSGMNILVYDMCTAIPKPFTEKLFTGIAKFLEDYTSDIRQLILEHDDIVTAYARAFEKYFLAADYASMLCDYLNRLLLKSKDLSVTHADKRQAVGDGRYRRQTIQALALLIWKDRIVHHIRDNDLNRLLYQVFEFIRRDRDGENVPNDVVNVVVKSLVQLNSLIDQPLQLYIEEFERPYLIHTKRYYQREAARVIASASISEYMKQATLRLAQEVTRNHRYCHPTSYTPVIKEFEAQYITFYQGRIHAEFESLIDHEYFEDCTMAYNLLTRIEDGVKPLLKSYEEYITRLGKNLVLRLGASVSKDPREYVDSLLSLHNKYTSICQRVFNNDPAFLAAVDKAFRTIVNDTSTNPNANGPEALARFCDMLLKRGSAKKDAVIASTTVVGSGASPTTKTGSTGDDGDVEEKLTRMIIIFKYVDDKDVFQKFYSRMLAKRLIFSTSSSEEAEANMISRLKDSCGVEYTSKLHRMFTDITLSADLNNSFREFVNNNGLKLGVSFEIMVLTAGAWPLAQNSLSEFRVPVELEKSVSHFLTFYDKHHSGRKLSWLWHLAKGDVRLNYSDKHYELSVSLHQMSVLLFFNTVTTSTVHDIREQTGLNEAETVRVIKSLVDVNLFKLSTTELDDDTEVSINISFSSKRTKIKVSTAMQTDTPQETDATRKAVDEDRRLYLQAAVVRVMKARQLLTHTQLVNEVIDQAKARFKPSIAMIKKCIEHLLEKQYLERDGLNRYMYVA